MTIHLNRADGDQSQPVPCCGDALVREHDRFTDEWGQADCPGLGHVPAGDVVPRRVLEPHETLIGAVVAVLAFNTVVLVILILDLYHRGLL